MLPLKGWEYMTHKRSELFGLSTVYEMAKRLHSGVPYHFMKNGYAFPAMHYYIELTRRCNLRCRMCQYIEWLESEPVSRQREGELSTDQWHRVIDQIGRFSLVTFTGGEVFVRKDFMELLEHASSKAATHFISNTTMLTDERAKKVVQLAPRHLGGTGCNVVGTSIEGPGDRHDEIRKLRGAFERSMQGVQTLVKYRDEAGKACPKVHVTTVIQEANVDVLHLMPQLVAQFGADVVNLVTETRMHDLDGIGVAPPGSWNYEDLRWPHIERDRLSAALERTEQEAKKHGLELRLPRMPREDLLRYYDEAGPSLNLKDYECRTAWTTLIIGYRGDVFPCWLQKVGNVTEDTLKDIWKNAEMRAFRQTCQRKLFAPCPGCCFLEYKDRKAAAKPAAADINR